MVNFKLIGTIHDMDIEIDLAVEDPADIGALVLVYKNAGMKPKPKFQKNDTTFEPFIGTVEKRELGEKTKTGKDMYIAHVRPDVAEGEAQKPLFAVKYLGPITTYRDGDKVKVSRSPQGWNELAIHEEKQEPF